MSSFPKRLSGRFLNSLKSEKKLRQSFRLITGRSPINLALYKQAMRHSSVASINEQGIKNSYERLEYLGDAILGMIIAEYLYMTYPFKEEGFLTEIRAKIVNRESLNKLGQKIGLKELVQYNQNSRAHRSVYGDCMEALIGAVYLDHGFEYSKKFVIKKLVKPHYDLEELVSRITNYKSRLLEWSQKENKELRFEIIDEEDRKFTAQVFINDQAMSKGFGFSKKKAEQDAAHKTYEQLNLDQ
ncbi:ribonuclease III [Ekhidna sp. To15]|uniref:ribonuclease III n=1 Tax=Ekhidna sp. To15 TaxID=3395267 RepID=UPI003F527E96